MTGLISIFSYGIAGSTSRKHSACRQPQRHFWPRPPWWALAWPRGVSRLWRIRRSPCRTGLAMPRPYSRARRQLSELYQQPALSLQTESLHERALRTFAAWLTAVGIGTGLAFLVAVPALLDRICELYGTYLFEKGFPLHHYRYTLTALQGVEPSLRHAQFHSWSLLSRWEGLHPVTHRTPTPLALLMAIVAIAIAWGWHDFAGVTLLAFFCPGRIGEPIKAARRDLLLPCDSLLEAGARILMRITLPKTRGRGPAVQHIAMNEAAECQYITWAFSLLAYDDPLWPQSAVAYRRAWNQVLDRLLVPRSAFGPGGLRGGGPLPPT